MYTYIYILFAALVSTLRHPASAVLKFQLRPRKQTAAPASRSAARNRGMARRRRPKCAVDGSLEPNAVHKPWALDGCLAQFWGIHSTQESLIPAHMASK